MIFCSVDSPSVMLLSAAGQNITSDPAAVKTMQSKDADIGGRIQMSDNSGKYVTELRKRDNPLLLNKDDFRITEDTVITGSWTFTPDAESGYTIRANSSI